MRTLVAVKHTCDHGKLCRHPPRYKLAPDQKLRKPDVRKIISDPRGNKSRWIIYRLMEEPITLRTAHDFLDAGKREHTSLAYGLNKAFRERVGVDANAIIIEGLDGVSSPKSFWVMKLNPEIFELAPDYGKLVPNKHFKLADLLTPDQRSIIRYLAENPYMTVGQMKTDLPEKEKSINHQIIDGAMNLNCKRKGLPPALLRTKTEPRAWFVNPEFAALFDIEVSHCKGTLKELFKPEAQEVIKCIAAAINGASSDTVRKLLGKPLSFKISPIADIIEERCRELGLPKPFEKTGTGRHTGYKVTEEFRSRFELNKNNKEKI